MSSVLPIIRLTRNSIYKAVKDLSPEQHLAIPDGFDNNVAWNLGHLIAVQQRFCYLRCGLEAAMSEEEIAMYLPGTSPADWAAAPDTARLVTMLMEHLDTFEEDYTSGKFEGRFDALTTGSGTHIPDFETALFFNVYHESQHYGMIMALNNFVAR